MTSHDFAFNLLRNAGVGVCPGDDFGASGAGYIRLCYATSTERIYEGIKRIKDFVEGDK